MEKRETLKNAAFFAVILILVLVFLISGLHILESTVLQNGDIQKTTGKKTIVRNGLEYFPRQDITVMLVMGIDQSGPVQDSGYYRNEGAADVVMLLIFDEEAKDYSILYLNRDTMLTMPVLGIDGLPAGNNFGQLALSHTFGNGLERSCENVKKTVSDFLYGLQIDYYVSMNMDAVSLLNDLVGGVTVEVTEDFSAVDPTIGMGEVKLMGRQAINYVRTRKGVGDQLNLTRIQRQKEYIVGFVDALQKKYDDNANAVLSMYADVKPYLVTDCSPKTVSTLLSKYASYTLGEVVSPAGENVMGEEYFEFYVDEENLKELVLHLFYAPKE